MNEHAPPRPKRRRPTIRERSQRAVATGRVIPYLAGTMALLAIAVGFVATLIDREDFPSLEVGIWWAIVTLGTVGYGDVVPHTTWGRVFGSVVIVFGVTFISFLTASVTSFFLAAEQESQARIDREQRAAEEEATRELLRELGSRLGAIEARLDGIQSRLG
jgi:voltage-gated potassium channel